MGNTLGINWYARLKAKIADLEHKLEDTQAYNRELKRKLKNYENNNIMIQHLTYRGLKRKLKIYGIKKL
jgi:hypothetical protein